jgi:hypothetical protein
MRKIPNELRSQKRNASRSLPVIASRHLDLFSKHKEMNFNNFIMVSFQLISLSQLVNCVRLDLLHWWDHIPSNIKTTIIIHREL